MQILATSTDPFHRNIDALDANFGQAHNRRAAHAKGVVTFGTFTPTAKASSISRAGHFAGPVDVVARLSNFPGGRSHPDAAPECNPRGLAVQFRLPDGSTTDLLAHSINGFPGRTVDDFSDFLEAIAPNGPGPDAYLSDHPVAAGFVHAIQTHGTPASYAGLAYFPVHAFIFHNNEGHTCAGRYTWTPTATPRYLTDSEIAAAAPDYLATELYDRFADRAVEFSLVLQIADAADPTNDANATWPADRAQITLGTLQLTSCADDSAIAEQGLFFDPVRLVDGITLSDDPLLIGRTRTYPLSLGRRHQ